MRSKSIFMVALLSGAWALIFPTQVRGGLVFGPAARTQFENSQAVAGDTFIDFESVATGTNLTTQFAGVTFASISNTAGAPAGPFHVEVSGAFSGSHGNTIVGSPCDPGCVDDGRVTYEMVFATPQRRAGLERIWNTSTRTQFYNASDTLLAGHVNTVGTEFVGFIADGTNPATDWVSRIQIDSIAGLQVGYSDDLFFGTAISAFTVDSTADAVDAVPGDGACATAGSTCTLRAAIQEANALAGADTITLPAGTYILSIPGTGESAAATGDLDVSQDLTINGAGSASTIIDGGALDRVLDVAAGVSLDISGITIRNGNGDVSGGGIRGGDGASLMVTNSIVSNNSAPSGDGGGIYFCCDNITIDINNSIISDNSAAAEGGGLYHCCGSGSISILDSTVSGNSAVAPSSRGGGIYTCCTSATFTIERSKISNNNSFVFGGGIFNNGAITLSDSIVDGNTSGGEGGGIYNNFFTLALTNSTVSGNTSTTLGGGIFNNLTLSLDNVTMSGNSAVDGGGIYNNEPDATFQNTVVADSVSGGDCSGVAVTSSGHNLDSDGTCGLSSTGDLSSMDPLLGGLADNGGPTFTHALLAGSPAIDAGDNGSCPVTDQRGLARPIDGDGDTIAVCDIGAYESQVAAGMTGDGNGDGVLDAADLSACAALLGTSNAVCDADSSGTVDQSDIIAIVTLIFSGS